MIVITREIFLYGVILMIPPVIFMGFNIDLIYLLEPVNLANMLYLELALQQFVF